MANFARQYSTASPVLAIPPQSYHYQTQLSAGTFGRHHPSSMSLSAVQPTPPTPARHAGRKRSRDEASINLEPDSEDMASEPSQGSWVYGKGMILIKPGKGYVGDASSQSGTWVEEKNYQEHQTRCLKVASQPEMRGHKSQRMEFSPSRAIFQSNAASARAANSCHPGSNGDNTLVIDNFTIHLGIGWRKMSNEEHIQAAARGWAKFIENHFGLSNVNICLEAKGLQSYLVEAADGYYLFAENLRHGRLVSRTAEGALRNLQSSPPNFEGPELDLLTRGGRQCNNLSDSTMAIDQ